MTTPVIRKGGSKPRLYKPELMERILDEVSAGKTLTEVCEQDGYPKAQTVYKWIREHEDAFQDWEAVKLIKSHMLFDEAVELARWLAYGKRLEGSNKRMPAPESAPRITAIRAAIQTLLEAAAKLNPAEYGQRKANSIVVPIQIVTNMNLGQSGQPLPDSTANVYEITVEPKQLQVIDV